MGQQGLWAVSNFPVLEAVGDGGRPPDSALNHSMR